MAMQTGGRTEKAAREISQHRRRPVATLPQVPTEQQRELLETVLDEIDEGGEPKNEALEIRIEGGEAVIERCNLPDPE